LKTGSISWYFSVPSDESDSILFLLLLLLMAQAVLPVPTSHVRSTFPNVLLGFGVHLIYDFTSHSTHMGYPVLSLSKIYNN
jgi:hypothetical protein